MNTVDLVRYSFGTAFDILGAVTADVTQEQADWSPPGIANSIGAIYAHIVTHVDFMVHKVCMPQDYSVWTKPLPPEIILHDVQTDLPALHERAAKVRAAGEAWLSTQAPADLEQMIETSVGEINLGQMVDVYVIWHINAHCGEISVLKGCQGAKGYPW